MTDELLAAIGAAPDDDAPRLVWADREGGERGELVVLQCALARHDLPRADRKRFLAREKELLDAHAFAWSGGQRHARFVRGFVESLRISLADLVTKLEELFRTWPTLTELDVHSLTEATNRFIGPTPNEAWDAAEHGLRYLFGRLPPDRITSLEISSHVWESGDWSDPSSVMHFDDRLLAILEAAPSLKHLRRLGLTDTGITTRHIRALSRFGLERLHLGSHRLGGAGCVALLKECPTITRLAVWAGTPRLTGAELTTLLDSREVSRLKELDLHSNELTHDDLATIGACWGLRNLERLAIGYARVTDYTALHAIERSHHLRNLRELDLYGIKAGLAAIDEPTFADSLRVVRLHTNTTDLDMFPRLTALERVEAGG